MRGDQPAQAAFQVGQVHAHPIPSFLRGRSASHAGLRFAPALWLASDVLSKCTRLYRHVALAQSIAAIIASISHGEASLCMRKLNRRLAPTLSMRRERLMRRERIRLRTFSVSRERQDTIFRHA